MILILPPEESAELAAARRGAFPFVIDDPHTSAPRRVVVSPGAPLSRPDRPSDAVCFKDKVAAGAMLASRRRPCAPEGLSIVGFDDSDLGNATTPKLTTVTQPLSDMERVEVTQLLRLLAHDCPESLQVELDTRVIARRSIGAPALNLSSVRIPARRDPALREIAQRYLRRGAFELNSCG